MDDQFLHSISHSQKFEAIPNDTFTTLRFPQKGDGNGSGFVSRRLHSRDPVWLPRDLGRRDINCRVRRHGQTRTAQHADPRPRLQGLRTHLLGRHLTRGDDRTGASVLHQRWRTGVHRPHCARSAGGVVRVTQRRRHRRADARVARRRTRCQPDSRTRRLQDCEPRAHVQSDALP